MRDLNNTEMNNNFWNDHNVYRLPYLRGFIFALGLNCKMKFIDQDLSTDQVIKYFQKDYKKIKFSNEYFIQALKDNNIYTSDINQYFNDHIINGKVILLDNCSCHLPIKFILLNPSNKFQGQSYYQFSTKLNKQQEKQIIDFFKFEKLKKNMQN